MKNVTHTFAYYFLLTASSFLTTAAFSGLRAQTSTYDNFEGSMDPSVAWFGKVRCAPKVIRCARLTSVFVAR